MPRRIKEALHGDRVVVRIEQHRADGRVEGRIVQVLERRAQTIVGRYDVDAAGLGYVVRSTAGCWPTCTFRAATSGDAEPGEMVTVEITRWPTPTRGPIGRIIEVLGGIDEPGVDTEIILRKHAIPDEHSRKRSRRRGASAPSSRSGTSAAAPISAIASSSPSTASTRAISTTRSRSSG